MSISIKNGLIGGVIALVIHVSSVELSFLNNAPTGILSILVLSLLMYYTTRAYKHVDDFRSHVRQPFITLLIASALFHLVLLLYPSSLVLIGHNYILAFLVSLILGFLLAALLTFGVRKMA